MQMPPRRFHPPCQHRTVVLVCVIALGFLAAGSRVSSAGGRELSDEELDQVVAGVVDTSIQEDLLRFHYVGSFGASHIGEVDGTLSLLAGSVPNLGSLVIDHGAQTNLRSLVNVNAVNSVVNVLLNLNITIDSIVDEIHQSNQLIRNQLIRNQNFR